MSIKDMLSHLWMLFFSALAIAYQYHAKWAWQTRMFKCFRTTRLNKQFLAKIVLWNVRLYEALKWQTKRYKPHIYIYILYIYTFCAASKTHGGITPYCGIQTRIGTSLLIFNQPFQIGLFQVPDAQKAGVDSPFHNPPIFPNKQGSQQQNKQLIPIKRWWLIWILHLVHYNIHSQIQ